MPGPAATASAVTPRDNLRGLAVMALGVGLFACADTVAKILTAHYHPIQIVWTRQLGLLAVFSASAFIFALRYVALADAVAVSFVAPFMVTILGALVLGEPVGFRRWTAVAVGFAGTLVVIRPGMGLFHPAIFLVVLAAGAFAARQIVSRYLGKADKTATTVAYTSLTSSALLLVPLPFVWQAPAGWGDIAMMAALAVLAGSGEFMVIRALEIAHAVVVAPVHYSLILYSTFFGWVVFGQLPDGWTWVGVAIIMASGLYTLYREARAGVAAKGEAG